MKLIALKDFRNVPGLELKIADAEHDNHVHKGAIFDIGNGKTLKDCSKADQVTVAQLTVAGCVGDGTDAKLIKAIEEEVAADEKAAQAAAKANSSASDSALVAQLLAILKGEKAKA